MVQRCATRPLVASNDAWQSALYATLLPNAGSSFNFTPPGSETTPTGGLGAVELPNAGTENLTDFKPTLTIPEDEEG